MKTMEEVYNEQTLKHLGNNPQGTRMDIVYSAMKEFAKEAIEECAKKGTVSDPYQEGRRFLKEGEMFNNYIKNNPPKIDKQSILKVK